MICISCAGKLEPNMRHAMLSNLCPFCGQNIFTPAEADFRKSIFRILLKNGIEDDDLIARLVDDISNALRKDINPIEEAGRIRAAANKQKPAESESGQPSTSTEEITVSDDGESEDESDLPPEARGAPSRVLTPDPNRTRPAPPAPSTSSKVDIAMRAFEAMQKDSEDAKNDAPDTGVNDPGADEMERQFLKSSGIDPATILQQRAVANQPTRPGGFKNKPVRLLS
jgi:hypothetical protein